MIFADMIFCVGVHVRMTICRWIASKVNESVLFYLTTCSFKSCIFETFLFKENYLMRLFLPIF